VYRPSSGSRWWPSSICDKSRSMAASPGSHSSVYKGATAPCARSERTPGSRACILLARLLAVALSCVALATSSLDVALAEHGNVSKESQTETSTCTEAAEQRTLRLSRAPRRSRDAASSMRRSSLSLRVASLLRRPSRTDVPARLCRSGQQRTILLRSLLI